MENYENNNMYEENKDYNIIDLPPVGEESVNTEANNGGNNGLAVVLVGAGLAVGAAVVAGVTKIKERKAKKAEKSEEPKKAKKKLKLFQWVEVNEEEENEDLEEEVAEEEKQEEVKKDNKKK